MALSSAGATFDVDEAADSAGGGKRKADKKANYAAPKYTTAQERARATADLIAAEERATHADETMYHGKSWRETLFVILDEPDSGILARIASIIILVLIVASSVSIVIETMRFVRISDKWQADLKMLEWICIIAFSVEYLLKAFCSGDRPGSDQSVIRYLTKIMTLVDLFAILPFYIELAFGGVLNLAFLRALRMTRIFRVLKVGSYDETLILFVQGFGRCRDGLTLLLFLLMMYLCCFSAFLYMFEYDAQVKCHAGELPDVSCPSIRGFTSIPTSWYFIIATMTTVGYGDMYPITPAGQITASFCMLCGIFVLGLPIVIIGNSFDEVFKEHRKWLKDKDKRQKAREDMLAAEIIAQAEDGEQFEDFENPLAAPRTKLEKISSGENPLAPTSPRTPRRPAANFNTIAGIYMMADILESLFEKTHEPRFDEAWHVLMDDLDNMQAYDTNGDGQIDSWDTTGDGKIDLMEAFPHQNHDTDIA